MDKIQSSRNTITVLLNLLFFTALNLIFPHPYIVNVGTDQFAPLGVTEHLPGGDALLVAERQPRRLPAHDAAVGEGVVAQQRLGSGPASYCTVSIQQHLHLYPAPAGLGQRVYQLGLDGGRDLLVPPPTRVVLAAVIDGY